ncbi:protein rolling stone-like isoform X2 [Ostrinia furnacalis]|uniref:protein rolling stone-like isoform X2 n=1 Tax=Ostrinia furnacalis TaxID=93504 RepID=UPI00103B14A2|nr:protein rolling stone-like isoform X2 [Ostrinia furnacalis]
MTRWAWTPRSCAYGAYEEPTTDQFGKSCFDSISPLYWRVPILLWALSVTTWSLSSFWGPIEMFFLYMTHWGLLMVALESAFGIAMCVKKPRKQLPDATFGLPWYVKVYWVLYNITIPVAFLITVFYWGILKTSNKIQNYAPNPVLDIMLHGINSLVMFVELVFSGHPSRLLHIMQPLFFALAYLLFTVVYFYAGGNDPWGNAFIYPVIDWSKPEQTLVVVTLTALFLALMHLLVVAVAAARDAISRRLRTTAGIYNDGFGEES